MEETKAILPWSRIVPYLALEDISRMRLVSRKLYEESKTFFNPSMHAETLYTKFVQGLLTKYLSNSNCTKLLHPYAVPYYEKIKELRKHLATSSSKISVHGTLLDFPFFVYDTFNYFLHPETGTKVKFDQLLKERFTDSKTYGQIFHASDFRVSLTNSFGHVLKVPKQWVMPISAEDLEDTVEESKDKYEAFYKDPSSESLQIDFANQAMLCKRHEKLLEAASAKKEELKPFELIKQIGLWVILLCHGGSFSIGVFNDLKLVTHKSDKKYLIRKKAGKRQANKDKSKSVMTSAGSQLRREMEKSHQEHVANIMEECQKYLAEAVVIFLHAPGINRSFFLSEGKPLKPYMHKIKPIIVHTKKANFENVMEVFEKLTTVNLVFSPIP